MVAGGGVISGGYGWAMRDFRNVSREVGCTNPFGHRDGRGWGRRKRIITAHPAKAYFLWVGPLKHVSQNTVRTWHKGVPHPGKGGVRGGSYNRCFSPAV